MSNHVKGMTQRANGTHYAARILPLHPRVPDQRVRYIPRAMRPYKPLVKGDKL